MMNENIKNQQIFLNNINSLLRFEPYQNDGMRKLKEDTEANIRVLIAEQILLNENDIIHDFLTTFNKLTETESK